MKPILSKLKRKSSNRGRRLVSKLRSEIIAYEGAETLIYKQDKVITSLSTSNAEDAEDLLAKLQKRDSENIISKKSSLNTYKYLGYKKALRAIEISKNTIRKLIH